LHIPFIISSCLRIDLGWLLSWPIQHQHNRSVAYCFKQLLGPQSPTYLSFPLAFWAMSYRGVSAGTKLSGSSCGYQHCLDACLGLRLNCHSLLLFFWCFMELPLQNFHQLQPEWSGWHLRDNVARLWLFITA